MPRQLDTCHWKLMQQKRGLERLPSLLPRPRSRDSKPRIEFLWFGRGRPNGRLCWAVHIPHLQCSAEGGERRTTPRTSKGPGSGPHPDKGEEVRKPRRPQHAGKDMGEDLEARRTGSNLAPKGWKEENCVSAPENSKSEPLGKRKAPETSP